MAQDFYEVLGVSRDADPADIQRAYRRLARQNHPDVNKDSGAEERFKEIAEAYDVLSDPELRRRYDAFGEDFRRVPPDTDPAAWRQARTYADAGAGARGRWSSGAGPSGGFGAGDFGDDVDIEDLLGGIFGGRGRGGRGRAGWGPGPVPGSDHEAEVEVSVEEAYHGTERSFTISGPDGPRTLDVTIPAGVVDGQRIRLRGQGGAGQRLGGSRRPLPGGPDRRPPALPGRGSRPARAPADRSVGGRPGRFGLRRHSRRRRHGEGPGRLVQPPPVAAQGPRASQQARASRGTSTPSCRSACPRRLTDDEQRLFEELAKVSSFDARSRR